MLVVLGLLPGPRKVCPGNMAEAQGLLAIRKAEAEGFKLIGDALAHCHNPDLLVKLAGLVALQDVAQALGDGKATKILLPQNIGDLFSLVGGWKECSKSLKI